MKSNFGTNINYTIFGESHGHSVGITIQGIKPGFSINFDLVDEALNLRSGGMIFNTPRQEKAEFEIISGYFNEQTTGTPLTVLFKNGNTQSKDYSHLKKIPRPGHADFVANAKYDSAQDYRGGGHFSGRLSTPLIFLGSICKQLLNEQIPNFSVCSHILEFQNIHDISYYEKRKEIVNKTAGYFNLNQDIAGIDLLNIDYIDFAYKLNNELDLFREDLKTMDQKLPLINRTLSTKIIDAAIKCKELQDSAGGKIESIIINPPVFIGEPFFNSLESVLASLIYSVPSTKAVSFGLGDDFKSISGFACKDEIISKNPKLLTLYNNNGGINGGISNGEDIVINTVLKPIASINKAQVSLNITNGKLEVLEVGGRHDSTIINRVVPVLDAVICIGIYDLFLGKNNG